jgi:hypothetical protein
MSRISGHAQISPCRPRKQTLLNFFVGLSGVATTPGQSKQHYPPDIYPPPEQKCENLSLISRPKHLIFRRMYSFIQRETIAITF